MLEKTLESPLDCKEIKLVNSKGNQSWIFIGRTDVEGETPLVWPPDAKNWLIRKVPDAGKGWRQENGLTEDEMVEWHHRLNGHESEQTLGVGDGQGSLACCSLWGCKELDTTEQLNWTDQTLKLGVIRPITNSLTSWTTQPYLPLTPSTWTLWVHSRCSINALNELRTHVINSKSWNLSPSSSNRHASSMEAFGKSIWDGYTSQLLCWH